MSLKHQKKCVEGEEIASTTMAEKSRNTSLIVENMRKRREINKEIKKLEPSKRPNPFEPAKIWYNDRTADVVLSRGSDNCRPCIRKGSPFPEFNEWEQQKVSANW